MFDPHLTGSSQQAYIGISDTTLNPCLKCKAAVEFVVAYSRAVILGPALWYANNIWACGTRRH